MKIYLSEDSECRFRLPYDDSSCDSLEADHCLERVSFRHSSEVLTDWIRVLKPGGKLRVKTINLYGVLSVAQGIEDVPKKYEFLYSHLYPAKAAFDEYWFKCQLTHWGCEQIQFLNDKLDPELDVIAVKLYNWAECKAAQEGFSLARLPANPNEIQDYRGYEEFAPEGFNYSVYYSGIEI